MVDILALSGLTLLPGHSGGDTATTFDPASDMPSLAGKIILITGGAGDLGREVAIRFARRNPARIYIADLPRADQGASVLRDLQTQAPHARFRFLELDLGSFASVQTAAARFRAAEDRLDICVLNAGVMRILPGTTADGYELAFGVNYLGHALLVKLLLPTILRTAAERFADVRVVVVASAGHRMAPHGGIQFEKLATPCEDLKYYQRYGQSKVACIGFARELARAYPQLRVAAVHPGRIVTGMAHRLREESLLLRLTAPLAPLFCTSVAAGARNHLWAATSRDVVSGAYYEPVGVPDRESDVARDMSLSGRLWEWTADELRRFDEVTPPAAVAEKVGAGTAGEGVGIGAD
ncbi:hypothetical protein B0T22DRAFT_379600 [Podospora appendiculata]|uniref:Uncharacterized protein n=1 Tax=Podospora appendiculata TaxID=314037 RepID=A0AAE0X9J5_9PEZI|nr:hypothetical protein B0T22DRAFT_379600 [Podospora appendiculata]